MVAGVALPVVRRAVRVGPGAAIAGAAATPLALCVAFPRSRRRDYGVCVLQMWAYVAAYKFAHPEGENDERPVRIDYPIAVDRLLGGGVLPSVRLQRAFASASEWRAHDKALIWTHWVWFAVPHTTVSFLLHRHPSRFPRAAVLTYAVFDIGALCYWLVPTAPPWYAAERGRIGTAAGEPAVRRMMVEFGEGFWGERWDALYAVLGGNPVAAMPSLHFATSVMAASLLAETGPVAGSIGATYALALGFALVYLGEHYVADLLAGVALTAAVRGSEPLLRKPISAAGRAVARFGEWARAG